MSKSGLRLTSVAETNLLAGDTAEGKIILQISPSRATSVCFDLRLVGNWEKSSSSMIRDVCVVRDVTARVCVLSSSAFYLCLTVYLSYKMFFINHINKYCQKFILLLISITNNY